MSSLPLNIKYPTSMEADTNFQDQMSPRSKDWESTVNAAIQPQMAQGAYQNLSVPNIISLLDGAIETPGIPFDKKQVSNLKEALKNINPNPCKKILNQHDRFKNLLKKGEWYTAIRALLPGSQTDFYAPEKEGIADHWRVDFLGGSLTAFCKKIELDQKDSCVSNIYAKAFHIIQSSGSGKSRLVEEFAKGVMVFSFALRLSTDTGYPPTDPELVGFLIENKNSDPHLVAVSFLYAIFTTMGKWCVKMPTHNQDPKKQALLWKQHIEWPKNQHKNETENFDDTTYTRSEGRKLLCKDIRTIADQFLAKNEHSPISDWENTVTNDVLFVQKSLWEPLQYLLSHIPERQDKLPKLLLAFDEISFLIDGEKEDRYVALRRVIGLLKFYPLCVVFMTTNSQIELAAKASKQETSSRITAGTLLRLKPFISLEMNIHETARLKNPGELLKPLKKYATVPHVVAFGRPLWSSLSSQIYSNVLSFVKMKLLGGTIQFSPYDYSMCFALLSFRVALEPTLNDKKSITLAHVAVDSHLHILTAVDQESGAISIRTPSEPVVSDTAAHILLERNNWKDCLKTVTDELLNIGRVDKGMKGELYTRILMVLARDWVMRLSYSNAKLTASNLDEVSTFKPFSVWDFLSTLLGANLKKALNIAFENMTPAVKDHSPSFKEYMMKACMNFNHVSGTATCLTPKKFPQLLLRLLRAHAALQLAFNQKYWDLLIPVYAGDLGTGLELDKLSAIVVQVKNRVTRKPVYLGNEYKGFFGHLKAPIHVIYLHLELGVVCDDVTQGSRIEMHSRDPHCPLLVFHLNISGSDDKVFPVVKHFGIDNIISPIIPVQDSAEDKICSQMAGYNKHAYDEAIWNLRQATEDEDISMGGF